MTVIEHDPNEKSHETPSRVRKTLDFFLSKYQDMVESRNSKQLDKFYERVDRAAEQTLLNQGTDGKKAIFTAEDYLLNGELEKYAQAKYGTTAPYMWLQLPTDVLSVPVVNGRLPDANRSAPGELGFKDFDENDEQRLFQFASAEGRRAWTKTFLTVSSIAMLASVATLHANFNWPSYTELQYGMYLDPITRIAGSAVNLTAFLAKAVMEGGQAVVSAVINAIGGVGIAILASNFARDLAFTNAFNRELPIIKSNLTEKFSQPTRQGRYLWKNDTVNYVNSAKAYMRMAYQLVGRLKGQPFIPIGLSTGKLEERGKLYSPRVGVIIGTDAEGMSQHMLITGVTGSGKTRLGITPIAVASLEASYRMGKVTGCIVFDGKGILANTIRAAMPDHLKGNYITYSTQDGGVGLDILRDLLPPQIEEVFLNVAFQKAGNKDPKWINGAGGYVRQAAEIAKYADAHPEFLADAWKGREYTYYSLIGLLAISTDETLRQTIVKAILNAASDEQTMSMFPAEVIEAARGLGKLDGQAPETRASYLTNIEEVLGMIAGNPAIARLFGSGAIKGVPQQPLDIVFRGGMVGVGINPADDQQGGLLIANLIKTIFYTLAQKCDTAASRAREEILRIEAHADNVFKDLLTRQQKLEMVKNLLRKPETRDEANALMDSMYPATYNTGGASDSRGDWHTLDLALFEYIVNEKISAITIDSARYTKSIRSAGHELRKARAEVNARRAKLVTEGITPEQAAELIMDATTPRIKELIKIRDQTEESKVLCVIDEFHAYVTASGGITADTFFWSIARSTGTRLIAAVQTLNSIYDKIGETAGNALLSNFVNKIFFKTNDEKTKEYASKQSGMGIYDRMFSDNGWSTFPALLNDLGYAKPALWFKKRIRGIFGFMYLKGGLAVDNPLATPFRDYSLGEYDQVNAAQHEDNEAAATNETHNRIIARLNQIEKADTSGQEKPYMTPDDLSALADGHAFVILSRGNRIIMEEVDMNMGMAA
ncbi:type IV secretion system DNA-binding domain-containing protein [Brucella ciceri]|uniref:type IV secretion system DNA-binding domain-containing protein n=1 Tax=Brucella ciceri TaxID=391287 RepID=UPI001F14433E|nr:type IV secretion system DNA-binding domain-containing protein [Brucella ciceri]MCH6206381.1 type IV secretion system DNA-binding domain-containing protein [Brucella ciceri]